MKERDSFEELGAEELRVFHLNIVIMLCLGDQGGTSNPDSSIILSPNKWINLAKQIQEIKLPQERKN